MSWPFDLGLYSDCRLEGCSVIVREGYVIEAEYVSE
jgi:hypothetical protein